MQSRDDFDPATNTTAVGEFDPANATSVEAIARNFAGELYGADQNRFGRIDLNDGSFDEIGFFGTANHTNGDILIDEVNGLSFPPRHRQAVRHPQAGRHGPGTADRDRPRHRGGGRRRLRGGEGLHRTGHRRPRASGTTSTTSRSTRPARSTRPPPPRLIRLDVNLGAGTASVADIGAFGANDRRHGGPVGRQARPPVRHHGEHRLRRAEHPVRDRQGDRGPRPTAVRWAPAGTSRGWPPTTPPHSARWTTWTPRPPRETAPTSSW